MRLPVSEIFYSLQGEGARTGDPTVFVRIQGCKAKHACLKSGVLCDTEFESGKEWEVADIYEWILENAPSARWITWTGGEPADRITDEVVEYFHQKGYKQSIETSGLFPVAKGIDFVSVSPKVAEHVIAKNFPNGVAELRYVRHKGQSIPQPSIDAEHYYLSPHSDGFDINKENLDHCIKLCLENPQWKLSVQDHKLWKVL